MKKQRIFPALLLLLTVLAFDAAAQKDKLAPMPADSSLADGQTWISKNLSKNFGYSTVDDTVKISDMKFEGCNFSYRVFQRYTDQKAALGDRPALGQTGATTAVDVSYNVYEDVRVDLKQLNPTRVSVSPLPQPKGMQLIGLETVDKKDLIKFDRQGSKVRYNTSGMRNTLGLPVKENAAEALGKGFIRVIQLCQGAKP